MGILQRSGARVLRFKDTIDDAVVALVVTSQDTELFTQGVEAVDVDEFRLLEHFVAQLAEFDAVPGFLSGDERVAVMPVLEEVVE